MHNYHPSYMFNTREVTDEYNLLNSFLNNSLLDDGAIVGENGQIYPATSYMNSLSATAGDLPQLPANQTQSLLMSTSQGQSTQENPPSRPGSTVPPTDKARDYYLTAADPEGSDAPEVRMQNLLEAKYQAGMLKPFNYVKGYARLDQYMQKNMQIVSRQRILRQLDKFRPKFRDHMHSLTDMELVYVEMWFERSLMEYDRVFASMAIPACCWRRTGEIFRGNKEMAELIHQPIEKLRDVSFDSS